MFCSKPLLFLVQLHLVIIIVYCQRRISDKSVAMDRIIHGSVVDIKERPYQVALVQRRGNQKRIVCGGALVKPKVVFTAAHCTHVADHRERPNTSVLVGANSLDDPKGQEHKIHRVIKHPEFTFRKFDNDFSIVLLKKPVEFNSRVQKIPVSLGAHPEGSRATVSGWGLTEFKTPSHRLRAVDLTLEDFDKCQGYFPKVYHPEITRNMLCIKPGLKSTHYGDSGGPLTIDGKLVGLVSFGRNLEGNKKITVFSRVKNFLDFADTVSPSF